MVNSAMTEIETEILVPFDGERELYVNKETGTRIIIYPLRCKACRLCIDSCPKKLLETRATFSRKGFRPTYAARPDDCIKCRRCENICPDFAIYILEPEEEGDTGDE